MYNLDFAKDPVIVKEINEGDLLRFTIDEKTHNLVLKNVREEKNSIEITLFVEDSPTPSYISLGYDQKLLLDFYKDRVDDMVIVLESISQNKARLILRVLDEKGDPVLKDETSVDSDSGITGGVVVETSPPNKKTGLIIAGAIVLVGLIIVWLFTKK